MKTHRLLCSFLGAAGLFVSSSLITDLHAQGCVVARGGGSAMVLSGGGFLEPGEWQIGLNYRWLHSDRHFRGTEEEEFRQEEGTEVINDSHFFDLTATYAITRRFWLNLTMPFVYSDRSSLYEHKGNNSGERYSTQAGGLGDMRLTTAFWFLDPDTYHDGNFGLGLGIKAPTGDYKATDIFQRPAGPELRYVDSSIQPGDGGWGIILEAQGFHRIVGDLSAYLNASYLINPRDKVSETNYSVPDSYLARVGLDYAVWPSQGLTLSLGGRIEGVTVYDLVGEENGFRRPGYAISVEPGLTFARGNFSAAVTVPIAVVRNRQQSVPEKPLGRHGDAAFADFTVNASVAYRF